MPECPHYYNRGDAEARDVVRLWCPRWIPPAMAFYWGAMFKYMVRVGIKGDPRPDLQKLVVCAQLLLDEYDKEEGLG